MKTYNYIYLIKNNINQKIYVGKHSTDNLDDSYMGSGILIKKAITKYGIENFTKEYLAFCDTEDTLNYLEKFYIKKYKAREAGYNLTDGGEGTLGAHWTLSDETIEKMRKIRKAYVFSEEHKQNLRKPKSRYTEEHKQKISESMKGPKNPNFGKHRVWNEDHTKFQYK